MSLQQRFDETYISSTEICQTLGVNRSTVFNGARTGKLPEGIVIRRADGGTHIMLWPRAAAAPMIEDWRKAIASRKGQ